uniref:Acid phosphatase n=1 Tax=Timema monikensis TaxID=170555 RepID=A0A7R9EFN5_9NEOP|nr:unnamed protein product [Timema monikensis]
MEEETVRRCPIWLRVCHPNRLGSYATGVSLAFIITIILLVLMAFSHGDDSGTLQLVSVVFRHGDRSPTETYPADPHKDDSLWLDGWGALDKKGKMQMFKLGKLFKKRYLDFLSRLYSPKEMHMESSADESCLMSAELVLAGLYPPRGHQVWDPELDWQPIPVHSTPILQDKLIVMKKPCPRYEQELKQAYLSPDIVQVNLDNAELYSYLTEKTGKDIDSILEVELLYNTLEIEERNGLPLPEWTKTVYPGKMKYLASLSLALFTHNDVMRRLNGGPLVGDIAQHMADKSSGALSASQKLFLYSAHDITIVNVWRMLGMTEMLKPESGAALIVELHLVGTNKDFQIETGRPREYFPEHSVNDRTAGDSHVCFDLCLPVISCLAENVKFLLASFSHTSPYFRPVLNNTYCTYVLYFNNTSTLEPHPLTIEQCGTPCFLDTFLNLTTPVIPTDWEKECQLNLTFEIT